MSELNLNAPSVTAAVTFCAVAIGLRLVMSGNVSADTRRAQLSLVFHSGAALCLLPPASLAPLVLGALSLTLVSLANLLLLHALTGWLGLRKNLWPMVAVGVALPTGFVFVHDNAAWREMWTFGVLALQSVFIARTVLTGRHSGPTRRWRMLLGSSHVALAAVSLTQLGFAARPDLATPAFNPAALGLLGHVAGQISFLMTAVVVLVVWRREAEAAMEALANSDALTGLPNRRGWLHGARPLLAQARRNGWPTMVMMIDLDFFKSVNDEHGHQMGDRALELFGRALRACLRESDLAGRFGGEEFVVLMPQTNLRVAELLDARLRAHLREQSREQLGIEINFSSGLAPCDFRSDQALRHALIEADKAMYQAKADGRGRLHSNFDDLR